MSDDRRRGEPLDDEELLARIAGGLVGKVRELMMLLEATTREFAGLVEARAAQLESEGAEAS